MCYHLCHREPIQSKRRAAKMQSESIRLTSLANCAG